MDTKNPAFLLFSVHFWVFIFIPIAFADEMSKDINLAEQEIQLEKEAEEIYKRAKIRAISAVYASSVGEECLDAMEFLNKAKAQTNQAIKDKNSQLRRIMEMKSKEKILKMGRSARSLSRRQVERIYISTFENAKRTTNVGKIELKAQENQKKICGKRDRIIKKVLRKIIVDEINKLRKQKENALLKKLKNIAKRKGLTV